MQTARRLDVRPLLLSWPNRGRRSDADPPERRQSCGSGGTKVLRRTERAKRKSDQTFRRELNLGENSEIGFGVALLFLGNVSNLNGAGFKTKRLNQYLIKFRDALPKSWEELTPHLNNIPTSKSKSSHGIDKAEKGKVEASTQWRAFEWNRDDGNAEDGMRSCRGRNERRVGTKGYEPTHSIRPRRNDPAHVAIRPQLRRKPLLAENDFPALLRQIPPIASRISESLCLCVRVGPFVGRWSLIGNTLRESIAIPPLRFALTRKKYSTELFTIFPSDTGPWNERRAARSIRARDVTASQGRAAASRVCVTSRRMRVLPCVQGRRRVSRCRGNGNDPPPQPSRRCAPTPTPPARATTPPCGPSPVRHLHHQPLVLRQQSSRLLGVYARSESDRTNHLDLFEFLLGIHVLLAVTSFRAFHKQALTLSAVVSTPLAYTGVTNMNPRRNEISRIVGPAAIIDGMIIIMPLEMTVKIHRNAEKLGIAAYPDELGRLELSRTQIDFVLAIKPLSSGALGKYMAIFLPSEYDKVDFRLLIWKHAIPKTSAGSDRRPSHRTKCAITVNDATRPGCGMFSRRNRTDDLIPSAMKKEGNARGPEGMRQTKIGATRSWLSRNGRPGAERHLLSFFCYVNSARRTIYTTALFGTSCISHYATALPHPLLPPERVFLLRDDFSFFQHLSRQWL
ncbi:unnamed protein product [Nesidiocoris tenuis]|uniref:Uncharacterized protein n=1 Tax=Nesidiocoris tenuis TaxID=355587 RepID=A0A6H5H310_9HEMI|nr:unnamed protein product [Nesidiocoris tenuis]